VLAAAPGALGIRDWPAGPRLRRLS
jgi:hypothetical protein